jgi:hypothetical protein
MSEGNGFAIDGPQIPGAALIQFRAAMGLELRSNSGMIASRRVNAKTIIPILVEMRITHVSAPYTRARKIRAYNDLDKFMTDNGFEPRPLDIPVKRK